MLYECVCVLFGKHLSILLPAIGELERTLHTDVGVCSMSIQVRIYLNCNNVAPQIVRQDTIGLYDICTYAAIEADRGRYTYSKYALDLDSGQCELYESLFGQLGFQYTYLLNVVFHWYVVMFLAGQPVDYMSKSLKRKKE